ncbi:hypothetical protein NKH77_19200 [Streptomyces sp. M19]
MRAGAGRLDFSWGRGADGRWGRDGRVSLRSERCWALSVRPYGHDGGVRLVFRFAPGPDGTDGGGSPSRPSWARNGRTRPGTSRRRWPTCPTSAR